MQWPGSTRVSVCCSAQASNMTLQMGYLQHSALKLNSGCNPTCTYLGVCLTSSVGLTSEYTGLHCQWTKQQPRINFWENTLLINIHTSILFPPNNNIYSQEDGWPRQPSLVQTKSTGVHFCMVTCQASRKRLDKSFHLEHMWPLMQQDSTLWHWWPQVLVCFLLLPIKVKEQVMQKRNFIKTTTDTIEKNMRIDLVNSSKFPLIQHSLWNSSYLGTVHFTETQSFQNAIAFSKSECNLLAKSLAG